MYPPVHESFADDPGTMKLSTKKHEISYPHVNNNQKKHDIPFFSSTPEKKNLKKNSRIQQKLVACCVCSCFFPCVSPFEKTVLQGQIQKLKSFLDVAHLHLAGTRHEYHRPLVPGHPGHPGHPSMGRCERSP